MTQAASARADDDAPPPLPTLADIEAAATRLAGVAVRTPLLSQPLVDQQLGGRLLVKAEPLQRTGSFKFRGAYNRLSLIPAADRPAGVVAYSSGNHAQGVAAAAWLLGLPATIIMPADAPAIKRRSTEAWGARVATYDRYREAREAIAERLCRETGATLVPPFDDPEVIAGQGTTGLEIAEQAAEQGLRPDAVLVCCGGGGLTAGIALALADRLPETAIYTVEPVGFDDTARSLAGGQRLSNAPGGRSICDALLSPAPGELTFAVNRHRVAGGLTVSDDEVLAAMALALDAYKLVVEPGGAAALAAALKARIDIRGRTIVAVASGGNVDPPMLARAMAAGEAARTA